MTVAEAIKYKLLATMGKFITSDNPQLMLASWMTSMCSAETTASKEADQKKMIPE